MSVIEAILLCIVAAKTLLIVLLLTLVSRRLDNIGDRLGNVGRRLESANDRLDLQSACMGEVRADIQRQAKRRAREASQEAP